MKSNLHLRHEREQRGWSQARVAEQIGTDAVNVSRWERGFSSPSPYFREKLCNLFGKDAYDLGFLMKEDHVDEKGRDESLSFAHLQKSQQNIQNPLQPSRESRMLAALSYLFWWISGLPLLLLKSQDTFVLFHSLQSVLLFGAITLLEGVCLWLMNLQLPDSALLLFVVLFFALNAVALPTWIVGIVQAWRGNYSKLPFVGETSERLANAFIQRDRVNNATK